MWASRAEQKRIRKAVRTISDKPVSAVIITHWHGDHPLGLSAIREAWPGADIISTAATRDRMATEANGTPPIPTSRDVEYEAARAAILRGYSEGLLAAAQDQALSAEERAGWTRAEGLLAIRVADVPGTYRIPPNRTFADHLTLADPGTPIEVGFEGRANTEGDTVIWLPRQQVLIAGDIVVSPIPFEFNVYPAENIATLVGLRAYDYRVLIPGHGEALPDKRYLDLLIAFMRDVRARIAPLAQQGVTLEEATARLDFTSYEQAFSGDDPWLRLWFRDYALTPLLESAYREAKGEPLGPPLIQAA